VAYMGGFSAQKINPRATVTRLDFVHAQLANGGFICGHIRLLAEGGPMLRMAKTSPQPESDLLVLGWIDRHDKGLHLSAPKCQPITIETPHQIVLSLLRHKYSQIPSFLPTPPTGIDHILCLFLHPSSALWRPALIF
jgi:hypothetical protein